MHELSIAMSLVDIATEEAHRQHATSISAVHLRLGMLAGVVPEALRSAYELARHGTLLENSELKIEEVAVRIHCDQCGKDQPAVAPDQLCCATCHTPSSQVVSGRDLELFAMEVLP